MRRIGTQKVGSKVKARLGWASRKLGAGSVKGELPEALVGLSKLRLLDLGGNALSGSLPAAWGAVGAFPDMATVNLADNQLSGAPPSPSLPLFVSLVIPPRPHPPPCTANSALQKSVGPQAIHL